MDLLTGDIDSPVKSFADNRLVGGSSPPGPTTHSLELGKFPALRQMAPNWRALLSILWSLQRLIPAGGDSGRVVSSLEIPFPGNGDRLRRRHGSNVVAIRRSVQEFDRAGL